MVLLVSIALMALGVSLFRRPTPAPAPVRVETVRQIRSRTR